MLNLKAQVQALRAEQARNPQFLRTKSVSPKPEKPDVSANPQNPQAQEREQKSDPLEGLALLPDDCRFILRLMVPVNLEDQPALLQQYRARWLTAMDAEPVSFRKDNAGRRAANTYLREQLAPDL